MHAPALEADYAFLPVYMGIPLVPAPKTLEDRQKEKASQLVNFITRGVCRSPPYITSICIIIDYVLSFARISSKKHKKHQIVLSLPTLRIAQPLSQQRLAEFLQQMKSEDSIDESKFIFHYETVDWQMDSPLCRSIK